MTQQGFERLEASMAYILETCIIDESKWVLVSS